jgi:hypothetical protein
MFENDQTDEKASAVGGFTHVFVDRITNRPKNLDDSFKKKADGNIRLKIFSFFFQMSQSNEMK